MKKSLYPLALMLVSCAQLMNGELQPVRPVNANKQTYFTTCSGAVEDWNSCYKKAQKTCVNGYTILSKNENANGGFRDMTFQCIK